MKLDTTFTFFFTDGTLNQVKIQIASAEHFGRCTSAILRRADSGINGFAYKYLAKKRRWSGLSSNTKSS